MNAQSHLPRYDYVTLSPIFDSISKTGYHSGFDLDEVKCFLTAVDVNVIALGGVTEARLPRIREAGFYGAAMLGALFCEE